MTAGIQKASQTSASARLPVVDGVAAASDAHTSAGLGRDQVAAPRGFYPGVQIPLKQFDEARQWHPGRGGTSGTEANEIITGVYTSLDKAMTHYLGKPELANWSTFGKFASQNAGNQITRLEAIERTTKGKSLTALTSLVADAVWNPRDTFRNAKALQGAKVPGKSALDKVEILRGALVHGNTAIISDIAPAYDVFLRAESAGQDGLAALRAAGFGRPPQDKHGVVLQAFEKYAAARAITEELKAYPAHLLRLLDPDMYEKAEAKDFQPKELWKKVEEAADRRRQLVFHANLLLGFQEQMVSLQNADVFDKPEVRQLMESLSRGMVFHDSRGKVPLLPKGGNWADFTTRMGLREVSEEKGVDPRSSDLVIKIRDDQGRTRYYETSGLCEPGNITQYMNLGTAYHPEAAQLLEGTPERLSRLYRNNPVRVVSGWLGGLKDRLFGH